MSREPITIVVKENRRVIDRFKANSGEEAARILRRKYTGLGTRKKRSDNPRSWMDDLPGEPLL